VVVCDVFFVVLCVEFFVLFFYDLVGLEVRVVDVGRASSL